MSPLAAVLLSIFLFFPSPASSFPTSRCNKLTYREGVRADIMRACLGQEIKREEHSAMVVLNQVDSQISSGFSEFNDKLLLFGGQRDLKNFNINHFHFDTSTPDLVLNIQGNQGLTHLDISDGVNLMNKDKITNVRGNRYLTRKSINDLNRIVGSKENRNNYTYIQEPGECHLGEAFEEAELFSMVHSIDILQGCVYIVGNLQITAGAKQENWPKSLVEVRGCIQIDDTELNDVSFLDNIVVPANTCRKKKNSITENKFLPKIPESIKEDKTWVVKLLKIDDNPCRDAHYRLHTPFGKLCNSAHYNPVAYDQACKPHLVEDEILGQWLHKRIHDKKHVCRKIVANLTFIDTHPSVDTDGFSYVQHLHGFIEILNTTMTDIRLFPNLHTMVAADPKLPVINITGNELLKTLEFPSLNFIFSKAASNVKLIVIKNNGEYAMSIDEYQRLVYRFGEDRLDIDVENYTGAVPLEKIFIFATIAVTFIGAYVMWQMEVQDKHTNIRKNTAKSFDAEALFSVVGPMLPFGTRVRFWLRQRLGLAQ